MVNAAMGFPWLKPIFFITQLTSESTLSYSEQEFTLRIVFLHEK